MKVGRWLAPVGEGSPLPKVQSAELRVQSLVGFAHNEIRLRRVKSLCDEIFTFGKCEIFASQMLMKILRLANQPQLCTLNSALCTIHPAFCTIHSAKPSALQQVMFLTLAHLIVFHKNSQ